MKKLYLDIENSPMVKYAWSLWDDRGSIDQIIEQPRILTVAAKFEKKPPMIVTEWDDGRRGMLEAVAGWIDEADVLVTWNGQRFDMPWITGELVREGIALPSPVKHLDLMKVTKKAVRFPSYKLDYVAQQLLGQKKVSTGGFDLWKGVLAGDERARAKMVRYNIGDVRLTERLDKRLQSLPNALPHYGLYGTGDLSGCPGCGSSDAQRRGLAYTPQSVFQQFRCNKCGRWYRGARAIDRAGAAKT